MYVAGYYRRPARRRYRGYQAQSAHCTSRQLELIRVLHRERVLAPGVRGRLNVLIVQHMTGQRLIPQWQTKETISWLKRQPMATATRLPYRA